MAPEPLLKSTFEAYAPEYLGTQRGTITKGERGTIGDFKPAHLPGDTYVDKEKIKNMERLMDSHKNFSHKPFMVANPPTDTVKHGALDGTFSKNHGGYPHMFEALAPPKDSRWLGKIEGSMVNPMPVLVSGPKFGGPGYPTRTLGKESGYESEFNHDRVESLNRQYKLGYGPGFRTDLGGGKKGKPSKWNTTRVQPGVFDSEGTAFKKSVKQENAVSQQHVARYMSRAAALAARTNHASPFISATSERKLPTEVFGTFGYVSEPFIDDKHKHFEAMIKEQNLKKGVAVKFTQPPFRASGKTVLSKTTPSVMFRRR